MGGVGEVPLEDLAGWPSSADTAGITPPSRLLAGLTESRQAHSRQVARNCAEAARRYVPSHVELAETVGLLHDVGYTPAADITGFHPLDGAAYLHQNGYPLLVCHLVAGHAGSPFEHLARGGDLADYDRWDGDWPSTVPVDELRSILAWADLTTGPDGTTLTVTQRLDEILTRYPDEHPVSTYVRAARPWLEMAGMSPLASVDRDQLVQARTVL